MVSTSIRKMFLGENNEGQISADYEIIMIIIMMIIIIIIIIMIIIIMIIIIISPGN